MRLAAARGAWFRHSCVTPGDSSVRMRSPFRDRSPAEGARTISGKAPPQPKKNGSCNDPNFRGVSRLPQQRFIPGLAGTPARLTKAGLRVSGVRSPMRRESPDVRFRLVRDSRQRGRGVVPLIHATFPRLGLASVAPTSQQRRALFPAIHPRPAAVFCSIVAFG